MRQTSSKGWKHVVTLCVTVASLGMLVGCETGEEFRAVAGPGVKAGVSSIMNGLLDGVFAIVEPNSTTDSTTTSS